MVSGGAFARYAAVARQSDFVVTLEDAARIVSLINTIERSAETGHVVRL